MDFRCRCYLCRVESVFGRLGLVTLLVLALWAAASRAHQPEPTPQPSTISMAVKELATEMPETSTYEKVTTWIVNLLGAHPWIIVAVLVVIFLTNGLRARWPDKSQRPGWVAFTLGVCDPITGNFWNLLTWASTKTGLPLWHPPDSSDAIPLPSKPVPLSSVSDASKAPTGGGA